MKKRLKRYLNRLVRRSNVSSGRHYRKLATPAAENGAYVEWHKHARYMTSFGDYLDITIDAAISAKETV